VPAVYPVRPRGRNYTEVVAIICGCGLSVLTVILFVGVGLVLKHLRAKELARGPMRHGQKDAAFYEGLNPQSAQALVGSMSNQSFGPSASDQHLSSFGGQNAYYNRGFEIDQNAGSHNLAVHYEKDGGPKPIEIHGGRKDQVTFVESKA